MNMLLIMLVINILTNMLTNMLINMLIKTIMLMLVNSNRFTHLRVLSGTHRPRHSLYLGLDREFIINLFSQTAKFSLAARIKPSSDLILYVYQFYFCLSMFLDYYRYYTRVAVSICLNVCLSFCPPNIHSFPLHRL
jgi:hypothetical protein